MKLKAILAAELMLGILQAPVRAAEHELDTRHSFVEFRIQHVGAALKHQFLDGHGTLRRML